MQSWDALHQVRCGMVAEVRGYIADPQPTMTTEEILWVLVGRLVQGGNLHEHHGGQGEEREERRGGELYVLTDCKI